MLKLIRHAKENSFFLFVFCLASLEACDDLCSSHETSGTSIFEHLQMFLLHTGKYRLTLLAIAYNDYVVSVHVVHFCGYIETSYIFK